MFMYVLTNFLIPTILLVHFGNISYLLNKSQCYIKLSHCKIKLVIEVYYFVTSPHFCVFMNVNWHFMRVVCR